MMPEQKQDKQRKYSVDELKALKPQEVRSLADAAGLHEAILQTGRGVTPTDLWLKAHPEFAHPEVWSLMEEDAREFLRHEADKGPFRPVSIHSAIAETRPFAD